MQPEERDAASLWDMLEAAKAAVRIVGELSAEEFGERNAEILRLAIERKLEVMGEAARRVSDSFRISHREIPWSDIIGLRNVISHQYEKVDDAEIYLITRAGASNE